MSAKAQSRYQSIQPLQDRLAYFEASVTGGRGKGSSIIATGAEPFQGWDAYAAMNEVKQEQASLRKMVVGIDEKLSRVLAAMEGKRENAPPSEAPVLPKKVTEKLQELGLGPFTVVRAAFEEPYWFVRFRKPVDLSETEFEATLDLASVFVRDTFPELFRVLDFYPERPV